MTVDEFAIETSAVAVKEFPDGRFGFVTRMLFTAALCVTSATDHRSYVDRWCYYDSDAAARALLDWDGTGEPSGWHRHPTSGRRRPHGRPDEEFVHR